MHAFLITGINEEKRQEEISSLQAKYHAKTIEFPLQKIADVRDLSEFTKLSQKEETLILCRKIDKASQEALNAFLKNLEEPNKNIKFILTADSHRKVLQTIVSRCHLIRAKGSEKVSEDKKVLEYIKGGLKEKIGLIDKIKKRDEAISFVQNVIFFLHKNMLKDNNKSQSASKLEAANECLLGLKANGNINLHLSKFALKISGKI